MHIGDGTTITGSVIWSDTMVEKEAQIGQSVVGSWCNIGEKAKVRESSIISNRSTIHRQVELPPHSRLQPNSIA